MSYCSLVASHAKGKGTESDAVFTILKEANDAIKRVGKDKVTNASIGAIYDENENFATLSAVREYYQKISAEDLMNYAPIAGMPAFLEAAIQQTFKGFQPKNTYARAIATPGGTGGIRHIFYNYVEQGQKVLIPDWAWGPYHTIAKEHMRDVETYNMFDDEYKFSLQSIIDKTTELLEIQDNLVIVFNTPAHNPSGYSMSSEEWKKLIEFFKECAVNNEKKKIILLLDMAYMDYAGTSEETRGFMRHFAGIPANMFVTIAYSMSKSFLMYGMRSGAIIGLSTSKDVVEEFSRVGSFSNRGVWSNGTRSAQKLLADVVNNPELASEIDKERAYYSTLLFKRAAIFLKEAKEVELQTLPFHSGFFITVPSSDPRKLTEILMESNIYTVPLKKGIRFAICAVPVLKMSGMARKTKEALGRV
ncbi:MAG: aminotransferase class I/II-fold pyridoxal phosphate-dependent enzyme [Clostridia bacterium]|nr:aminotransferase class I/II-fold pyridoxal phosphate-dependent enzyme [Clostridia bacterium]MDD4048938.1 aminotransferase class I/II-fold pyridoxal phosphate-dependent enzyme [Clostridia bacterium]